MRKIVFVADFFLEQGVRGGAEYCNDELINMFLEDGYEVTKQNSQSLSPDMLESDAFYIVANFMTLNTEAKYALLAMDYLIYEHDHKYVNTNDPSKFVDMLAPQNSVINRYFYQAARAVFCQSKLHAYALEKNLLNSNIVNLGGNIWSDKKLDFLCSLIDTPKTRQNAVLFSTNRNKGTPQTVEYCKQNNIQFEFIQPCEYSTFAKELAKTERIIMFPQWLESFNRVIIEGRILGCKFTTNKLIGAASEPWFSKYKGKELADFLRGKREEIYNTFVAAINGDELPFCNQVEIPKVSIITSLYDGDKYIEHFLKEITQQTVFDKCELIILDANSPGNEGLTIKKYCDKFNNIIYKRLETRLSVQETMNLGIGMATGEYLTLWNVDDTRRYDGIEVLSKALTVDPNVDLVYADSLQTNVENETFDNNSSGGTAYEHSRYDFSKENMIKCLPGPMPMWRRTLNEKYGNFDEMLKFAGDWEMWLRVVSAGSRFKKIYDVIGLYYYNPAGLSTSEDKEMERFNEERALFHKYKHMFGTNAGKFEGYFR